MKTRLTYAMKNYLPWTLLALAVSFPLFGQGTLTKERIICLTPEQEEILSHMSIVYLDDGAGNLVNKTIRMDGVNLQIVNGLDATNGFPFDPDSVDPVDTVVNGVGNLVVGYNELGNLVLGDDRTGSHNIVVGVANSYTSFGGIVTSTWNMSSAPFASVTGGVRNTASGVASSVSGGYFNTASGNNSSVSSGYVNTASGNYSSVSGGYFNTASGWASSVSGGYRNIASGFFGSSVSGGEHNTASGFYSTSVSGGSHNTASGEYCSSVSGGAFNTASASYSSVSGGSSRSVPGSHNWRGGKYFSGN